MQPVNIGIIGLGNVGSGALDILAGNAAAIEQKLGFPLRVVAVCSRGVREKTLPGAFEGALRTTDWREVVNHPEVEVVAELIGGTTTASEIVEAAIRQGKSVVTANKELMALTGAEFWRKTADAQVHLAMEASVAGGIPIHAVLREGIAADRITTLYGILNGTCNYILTEIEAHGTSFDTVLKAAQQAGYAEADPSADVDGFDARSKLAILAALAFGDRVNPPDIYTEGIRRVSPIDFGYAHYLNHTIRLVCAARATPAGLILSVRPSLLPQSTILASVRGAYNAVWLRGEFGADTFYYGRGAGPHPTGVAVVSDLMRVAREIRHSSAERVSPFAHAKLGAYAPVPVTELDSAYYLRFRVKDQPGIIAQLATALAAEHISLDAVLQLPGSTPQDLPFVITVEKTKEAAMRAAVARMLAMPFLVEPPLVMPIEKAL
jgi:homoserine dehydrogenase